ncbi:MAG TPA: ATP-binding protein [Candidatus Obscuribacterales bacterium]
MGIGAKILFAFLTVIMIMVLSNAGYSLFLDYTHSRDAAKAKVKDAVVSLKQDLSAILNYNRVFATDMTRDPNLMTPYMKGDRPALASALKEVILKMGFGGFVTFIDKDGNVFYSTDSPAKFDYNARKRSSGVDYVFRNNNLYMGAACFTETGVVSVSSMVPIQQGTKVAGVVVVSQPINTEFLTGLVTKFQTIDPARMSDLDLALVSTSANKASREGQLLAVTPGLGRVRNAFVKRLEDEGIKAIPGKTGPLASFYKSDQGFETDGRWWRECRLDQVQQSDTVAIILVTTPVPDLASRGKSILMLAGSCGAVALLFAILFSAGISKGVSSPLRLLIKRTNELAKQKTVLPALEGLSGEWLELGELIDTSVVSMRQTVANLKSQINRQAQEVEEKNKSLEATNQQLESLNRQYSSQAKQLSEISKQINFANRQAVILQHKLDAVLQVSTEGFLILDQYGNVISANPVFLHWMGVTEAEIAGRLCFDLVKRPGTPRNEVIQGEVFATHGGDPLALINQFYPEGIVYHRWEDKSVEVMAHLQPIMSDDSNVQGYIMVLRDKSLRSENALLRGEIVTMLSENIRAQLLSAEPTWTTIMTNAAQTMHPSVGQALAELHSHYAQLLGVVDSLLMMYGGFVPPPAVQAPREQIVITRVIAECLEEAASLARERQLALDYKSVPGLPNIAGHKDTFKAILLPMLERMITVTAPGGRVRVEVQLKGSELRLGVSSSGPSLPEEEIADLFAGFIQGKHSEDTYSSRLSMYLARNNVERIGGRAWAESGAGRGTIVYFTLPVN